MQTVDQQKYDDWKAKQVDENGNPEPYGLECFNFAERWANVMEEKMSNGEKLEDIAKQTSFDVADGITGFMYGMAVSILSQCWKHGEQLRQWHNLATQIHDEGEKANKDGGVLNPALMNVQSAA